MKQSQGSNHILIDTSWVRKPLSHNGNSSNEKLNFPFKEIRKRGTKPSQQKEGSNNDQSKNTVEKKSKKYQLNWDLFEKL